MLYIEGLASLPPQQGCDGEGAGEGAGWQAYFQLINENGNGVEFVVLVLVIHLAFVVVAVEGGVNEWTGLIKASGWRMEVLACRRRRWTEMPCR